MIPHLDITWLVRILLIHCDVNGRFATALKKQNTQHSRVNKLVTSLRAVRGFSRLNPPSLIKNYYQKNPLRTHAVLILGSASLFSHRRRHSFSLKLFSKLKDSSPGCPSPFLGEGQRLHQALNVLVSLLVEVRDLVCVLRLRRAPVAQYGRKPGKEARHYHLKSICRRLWRFGKMVCTQCKNCAQ